MINISQMYHLCHGIYIAAYQLILLQILGIYEILSRGSVNILTCM